MKQDRIALVQAPQPRLVEPCAYPPLGIAYVVAEVRRQFPETQCDVLDLAGHTLGDAEAALKDYKVIGYTAVSSYWMETLELARKTREFCEHQVVGGPHVTVTGDTDSAFEAIVAGPGELAFCDYLRDIRAGTVKPTYYGRQKPLPTMPLPPECIGKRINPGGAAKTAVLVTSRGCAYRCIFCAARGLRERMQFHTLDDVVARLEALASEGIREIRFMDDSFTTSRPRLLKLCERIEPMGIRWACMAHVGQMDGATVRAMVEAGCTEIAYGLESFDDAVLTALQKHATAKKNIEVVEMTRAEGCEVYPLIMMSTPGETYQKTADLNIKAMSRLEECYQRVLYSTLMPHPGTAIRQTPDKFGVRIVEWDASKYTQHSFVKDDTGFKLQPVWSPLRIGGMTEEQQMENLSRVRSFLLCRGYIRSGKFS